MQQYFIDKTLDVGEKIELREDIYNDTIYHNQLSLCTPRIKAEMLIHWIYAKDKAEEDFYYHLGTSRLEGDLKDFFDRTTEKLKKGVVKKEVVSSLLKVDEDFVWE